MDARYGGYPPRKGDYIVTALKWIAKGLSALLLSLSVWTTKVYMRLSTGSGSLERILVKPWSPAMPLEVEKELFRSRALADLMNRTIREPLPFNVKQIATQIITQKGLNMGRAEFRNRTMPNLLRTLTALNGANYAAFVADQLAKVKYDTGNADHEAQLEGLWAHLMPGRTRTGRITREWGDIGFQGTDPASDFRGLGMLGLSNLVYFATQRQSVAIAVLTDANRENGYPFAITGINLTWLLLSLVKTRRLDNHFFSVLSEGTEDMSAEADTVTKRAALDQFHAVFCIMFQRFNDHWFACNPINVLAFPGIFQEFQKMMEERPESLLGLA